MVSYWINTQKRKTQIAWILWQSDKKKVRKVPVERVVMEEEHTSKFTSGIKISPIDSGSMIVRRVRYERRKRRVKRSEEREIRGIISVFITRMYASTTTTTTTSFPLLVPHFSWFSWVVNCRAGVEQLKENGAACKRRICPQTGQNSLGYFFRVEMIEMNEWVKLNLRERKIGVIC